MGARHMRLPGSLGSVMQKHAPLTECLPSGEIRSCRLLVSPYPSLITPPLILGCNRSAQFHYSRVFYPCSRCGLALGANLLSGTRNEQTNQQFHGLHLQDSRWRSFYVHMVPLPNIYI